MLLQNLERCFTLIGMEEQTILIFMLTLPVEEISILYLQENRAFFEDDVLLINQSRSYLAVDADYTVEFSKNIQNFLRKNEIRGVINELAFESSFSQDQLTIERLKSEASEPLSLFIIGVMMYVSFVSYQNTPVFIVLLAALSLSAFVVIAIRRRRLAYFIMHVFVSRYVLGPTESTEMKPEPS